MILLVILRYRQVSGTGNTEATLSHSADILVECVMELTSTMAEHQLPEATASLLQSCGSVCDAAAMNNCLEALGAALGMQSA